MAKVRKANVVLTIKDSEVNRFVDLGYDVIDDNGTILQKTVPNDLAVLKNAYIEHTQEIEKLTAELAKAKSELAKAKKANKKAEE